VLIKEEKRGEVDLFSTTFSSKEITPSSRFCFTPKKKEGGGRCPRLAETKKGKKKARHLSLLNDSPERHRKQKIEEGEEVFRQREVPRLGAL